MADSGARGGGGGKGGDGGGKGAGGGDGNDEKLAQFIAVTGVSSEDVANHWLEANAYSLENAVSMFMDSGAGGGAGGGGGGGGGKGVAAGGGAALSTPAFPSEAGGPQPGDPDYVRPADPYKRQRLVEDPRSHGGHPYGGMATAARWSGAAAQGHIPFRDFQEEHRQAALASNPFASAAKGKRPSDPAAAEKQKKLASMFSPPTDIMFMGDFQAARQAAKQQKKWLLVNIQTEAEFDCHRLNRDVWKDEMVQNIIECNCIFWQQPSISEEAKLYCRRYNATGFPHIALIDPRTGMKVWSFQGFLAPPEFIEKVTDVTDKISFEDGAPERLPPPPPRQPQLPPSTGGSEDQMLAAAIAASLDAGNGGGSDSGSSSGGAADTRVMAAPPTSSGGGSGAPVATVAGGPISVDDSEEEEEEEEEEDGDVAVLPASAAAAGLPASKAPRQQEKGKARAGAGAGGGAVMAAGKGEGGSTRADAVDVTEDSGSAHDQPVGQAGAIGRGTHDDAAAAAAAAAATSAADCCSSGNGKSSGGDASAADMDVEGKEEEEEEERLEDPPGDDCAEKISVRFQLPTGARVLRKFRKSSDVRQLFLFVRTELEGAKAKPFDVRTVRPPCSVRSKEGSSIEDAGLSNSTVVVAWED